MLSLTPARVYCLFSVTASAVVLTSLLSEQSHAAEEKRQQPNLSVPNLLIRRSSRLELLNMIKACLQQTVKADKKAGQAQQVPPHNRALSVIKAEKMGSYHCSSNSSSSSSNSSSSSRSNSSGKCLLHTNSPSCRTGGHRKAGALTLI